MLKDMLKKLTSGISAGILIGIGGSVYLGCTGNRYVGAILFSVALLCICYRGYALFTGRVGFLPEDHSKEAWIVLGFALLGNTIGAIGAGQVIRRVIPNFGQIAEELCAAKMESQQLWQTLLRAVFCGILMYLAVSIYRDKKTPLGILLCIPTFILAGFEHSIADMFYFGAAGYLDPGALLYLLVVVIGNAIGGVLLPLLNGVWNTGKEKQPEEGEKS